MLRGMKAYAVAVALSMVVAMPAVGLAQAAGSEPAPLSALRGPADAKQIAEWRREIKQALFIPEAMPAIDARSYGSFTPVEGVVAERVTYATTYGMRVPAIVYRPAKASGRMPGLVVVNGHSGDKTSWYAYYTGILYARAGAVVVTYDPVGEDERNSGRASETQGARHVCAGRGDAGADGRADDRGRDAGGRVPGAAEGCGCAADWGGGVLDGVVPRCDCGGDRSADPRAGAVGRRQSGWGGRVLGVEPEGDVPGGSIQGAELSGRSRRGAVCAEPAARRDVRHQWNEADPLVHSKNTLEPFFEDLRNRTAAITGTRAGLFETYWIRGRGTPAELCDQAGGVVAGAANCIFRIGPRLRFRRWARCTSASGRRRRARTWAAGLRMRRRRAG